MKILCCLDGTNTEAVSRAARMFAGERAPALGLLTVVDVGPRKDIDRIRERFWRPPMHREPVIQEMLAAEKEASEAILQAGLQCFGKPLYKPPKRRSSIARGAKKTQVSFG